MQGRTSIQLLDSLYEQHLITSDQRRIVETDARQSVLSIPALLCEYGFVDDATLREYSADECDVRLVSLDTLLLDSDALQLIDADTARRLQVMPVFFDSDTRLLEVAISDPTNVLVHDALDDLLGRRVSITYCQASLSEIEAAITRGYGFEQSLDAVIDEMSHVDANSSNKPVDAADAEQGHPVLRLTNGLIMQAYRAGASDIHFEPEAHYFRVRFRIDGLLVTWRMLHIDHWPACATRLKVIGGLNIAETRTTQDGAFSLSVGSTTIDLRLSVFPTLHGENIVLRLLDPANACKQLDQIGFNEYTRRQVQQVIDQPQGLVLLVGPTGCGKTTTLYALLNHLADDAINIMTLEDPVEYRLPGIRQSSVQAGKLDFAAGVRGILRQDPDIILIGEIRDHETAELALRASMTGHLVFATLHTRSALGAYQRLTDLGVEQGVLLESVIGVISQRLLRTCCNACDQRAGKANPETAKTTNPLATCSRCRGSGFSGRRAIAEVLCPDTTLREIFASDGWIKTRRLCDALTQAGFQSLDQAARQLLDRGMTTAAEVQRVLGHESRFTARDSVA